jgi:hypothetical protein
MAAGSSQRSVGVGGGFSRMSDDEEGEVLSRMMIRKMKVIYTVPSRCASPPDPQSTASLLWAPLGYVLCLTRYEM